MNILILNKDLRIENNNALKEIAKLKENIYIFYFINYKNAKKETISSINYLKNRLYLLNQKIKINIFKVNNEIQFLESINIKKNIKSIYINKCFTPFSIKREEHLKQFCLKNNITFNASFDYLCFYPGSIKTQNNTVSKVFASFYKKFLNQINQLNLSNSFVLPKVHIFNHHLKLNKLDFIIIKNFPLTRDEVFFAIKRQTKYKKYRDQLAYFSFPSKIAAAINWGVISFTEVIIFVTNFLGKESDFLRQLIFREFYYHYYFANRLKYIISLKNRSNILSYYNSYPWIKNEKDIKFQSWKNAQTGVKLIDAAMNELKTTFNMKNRMRMVVASFLTKNLNIDWRLGERHFAKYLIDYDPVINNQSWQWAAGSGLDYRGNSRIFSISRQQIKYDPFEFYINRFLPKNHKNVLKINLKKSTLEWKERYKNWSIFKQQNN